MLGGGRGYRQSREQSNQSLASAARSPYIREAREAPRRLSAGPSLFSAGATTGRDPAQSQAHAHNSSASSNRFISFDGSDSESDTSGYRSS